MLLGSPYLIMPTRGHNWSQQGTKASRRAQRKRARSSRFYAVAVGRIGIVFHLDYHKLHEKYIKCQDFVHSFHRCTWNIHPLNSKFLSKVWVTAFVNLLWHVDQHTNRTKVYLNGLGRLNCVNTELMSFQHLRSMIAKGVPRMVIGSPRLQNWTYNHVLTISYVWIHQIGSLTRAKVLLISKVGVVTHIWLLDNMKFVSKMIKITFKWWKFVHRSRVWDTYTV